MAKGRAGAANGWTRTGEVPGDPRTGGDTPDAAQRAPSSTRSFPYAAAEGRRVRARRPLPTGRAVIGAFLMTAAAVAVYGAWSTTSRRASTDWVVAARALPAGTRLAAGDLRTEQFDLPGGAGAYSAVGSLVGRTLAAPLAPGELVEATELVRPGGNPALRPVTVMVDPADRGDLAPGRLVDVLVTNGTGSTATTTVVLRGAVVLNVSSASSSALSGSDQVPVTLGVKTFTEVAALVEAQESGTLSTVIGEPADGRGLGAGRLLPPGSGGTLGSGAAAGGGS